MIRMEKKVGYSKYVLLSTMIALAFSYGSVAHGETVQGNQDKPVVIGVVAQANGPEKTVAAKVEKQPVSAKEDANTVAQADTHTAEKAEVKKENKEVTMDYSLVTNRYPLMPSKKVMSKVIINVRNGDRQNVIYNGLGEEIVQPADDQRVDEIEAYENGTSHVYRLLIKKLGHKQIMVKNLETGKELILKAYDVLVDRNVLLVKVGRSSYDVYSLDGKKLNKDSYDDYYSLGSLQYAAYEYNNKYGLMDKITGKKYTKPNYMFIYVDDDNKPMGYTYSEMTGPKTQSLQSFVKTKSKDVKVYVKPAAEDKVLKSDPQVITSTGERITDYLTPFSEGIAFVKVDKGNKYAIDKDGKLLFNVTKFDSISPFKNGVAMLSRKATKANVGGILGALVGVALGGGVFANNLVDHEIRRAYVDHTGKELISLTNDYVTTPENGFITVYNDRKVGLYNEAAQEILPVEYDAIDSLIVAKNYFMVTQKKDHTMGIFDGKHKNFIVPLEYNDLHSYGLNTLVGKKDGKYYTINLTTNTVSQPLDWVFGNDYIKNIIENHDFSGLILPYVRIPVKVGDTFYLLDPYTGQLVVELPKNISIIKVTPFGFIVKKDGLKGFYNYEGKEVLPVQFENIDVEIPLYYPPAERLKTSK